MVVNHEYFMQQALAEARKALDQNEFPVGCVMVYENKIIAHGARQHSQDANEMDHAEIITLRSFLENKPGINRNDIIVYSTMEPCLMCFATMIISGIRHIVYSYEDVMGGGTDVNLASLPQLYKEMDIEIIPFVLRKQSLALFKEFFTRTDSSYLQDTMLAEYTRDQPL